MFLLRCATVGDLEPILELAELLGSPNLPRDRAQLRARLERSERAVARPGPATAEREYQFVLLDGAEAVVGTCAILSKHGTPEMPHLYLRVREEERRASRIEVAVRHLTLQLEASYDGPSELGALVLDPSLRGRPGWPGKLLSWGRFAFMALHPGSFRDRVMAEMRATLDPEGRYAFWHAFGERFTGMSYEEADRRSTHDKSFILELFPASPFYASLLDADVADQLGQVHPDARPALRLLEQAGLRWIGEIDPFDAGPFYGAAVREVGPIRETRRVRVASGPAPEDAEPWIVSAEGEAGFRALATPAAPQGEEARLPKDACRRLGVTADDEVWLTPLPRATARGDRPV